MKTASHYLHKLAIGIGVFLLTISTSFSDDIDVYVAPTDSQIPGEILVVFTLDLRSDVLASEVCTNTLDDGTNECQSLFDSVGMTDALSGHTSFLELLTAALKKVLGPLDNPDIKVALVVPHNDTGGGNKEGQCLGFIPDDESVDDDGPQCSNGAYVLSALKSTGDDPNTTDIDEGAQLDEFFEKVESIPLKDDTGQFSHDYQLKEVFFEMYRYLVGGDVYNGENGLDDFNGDPDLNINDDADTISVNPDHDEPVAELMWDSAALTNPSDKRYASPLATAEECTTLYSVNVVKGTANKDDDSDEAIQAANPDGLGIALDGSNFESRVQVLEYLSSTDLAPDLLGFQNLESYFVTVESGGSGDTGGRSNDWAQAGGTISAKIATSNPEKLVEEFGAIFDEIVGVSTTFVAASVPANVFNRAETLNEVFLAIFEPDTSNFPFWNGNVKKLTTETIEGTVEGSCEDTDGDGIEECETEERKILVDVLEANEPDPNDSAINPNDGRIRKQALTYWTRTGADNEYLPAPTGDEVEEGEFQEGTDGRKVDRGGAGQVKPGYLGIGTPGEPGVENDSGDTTISGPRMIITEADDDDGTSNGLVNLDADSGQNTAENLLTDGREYPGTSITYGAHLYQTVMSDCTSCASSYVDETDSSNEDLAETRVNNLIKFARGYAFTDIDTPTPDNTSTDGEDESIRPWWQADPLHSRPLALNFGARDTYTEDDPDIRVIVSGNDGMVQMIRDGRTPLSLNSDGSPEDGVEAWAFLPREFVPLQKRLLEQTKGAYYPGEPTTSDPITGNDDPRTPLHPYAMDGAPTALVIDNNLDGTINSATVPDDSSTPDVDESLNGGDRAILFIGQRRGGKRYYALEVSDPDNPQMLWSFGKDTDINGRTPFEEMAQSWSQMEAGVMQVDENGTVFNRPVLAFTGGYNGDDGGDGAGDLGKDSRVEDSNGEIIGTDDQEGNALFIVNALTGELIWKAVGPPSGTGTNFYDGSGYPTLEHAGLVDSVAASPTIVDSNGDGLIDRMYFPDTGGNVWRMDAGNPDRSTWRVNKLFSGGRHFIADNANDRRFFNAPDVVFASDDNGNFDAVILASGDRAHPLGVDAENWLYMIKDRNTTSGSVDTTNLPLTHADLADLSDNCLQDGDLTNCDSTQQANLPNGWKLELNHCVAGLGGEEIITGSDCGEKSLASPLTIEGTIFLTSYLPTIDDGDTSTVDSCEPKEGSGLFYALDLQTAGGVLNFDPSNDTTSGETPDRFDKLKSPGIPPEPVAISPDEVLRPDLKIQKTKGRKSGETFWYERRFN